ncbi:MAG: alpha/beta hydrolase [Nitrososphaera sp.]
MAFYETPSGRINVIEMPATDSSGDAVLCIHGFCCDARVFAYAGEKLAQAGFSVFSMDLPGHGGSSGPKGDLEFDSCLKSINLIISDLRKKFSRVFILAHSMGSTFALWCAHSFRNSVDGLILMSPYIRITGIKRSDAEPSPLVFIYLLMGRLLSPYKLIDIRKVLPGYVKIGGTQYARMAGERSTTFNYSFRYLIDIVARRNSMMTQLSDVQVPVLIVYGLQDKNVYPQVSEEFFKLLKTANKTIRAFDCNHWFYDAIFYNQSSDYREEDRENFMSALVEWLTKVGDQKKT